ncbi:hypothetical protein [Solimicrobium silvestre]|uniref:Uncharacterized protein n=1 Tax=Solimicrobium silvestre TaxID=2099400 RepID=A0A2S9GWG1_9BURK|nr:hypothetical protein [Solimicrobium silvestre]PRC92054.1 hypothetical protein S2091_3189 [Solimicrobium silvestre]
MNKILIALFLMLQSFYALASDQSDCAAGAGAYISGIVVSGPVFQAASSTLQGVQLSHTHVQLLSDQDGQTYDVAIDNVYAVDYVLNATTIPKSLAAIHVNDRLSTCGALYTSGGLGTHWVHNNCNVPGTAAAPNGFIKKAPTRGPVYANLERSMTYCYLWGE